MMSGVDYRRSNYASPHINDDSDTSGLLSSNRSSNSKSSIFQNGRFPEYLRRLGDFRQMDFEATFDQILSLLSWEPQKV